MYVCTCVLQQSRMMPVRRAMAVSVLSRKAASAALLCLYSAVHVDFANVACKVTYITYPMIVHQHTEQK